ncbi:hypothetical protein GCK32_004755 [Trichostrongylus colubriformis]|uniref:rRNA-processing protein UTP23 homolog n=1 Tax=Trichostrongylus colubriformis TaxID=6319 RepID=A0AAN8FV77_TRICO
MSSTWEFIKRHKGKIIALGVLAGGAAAGTVYALHGKENLHGSPLSFTEESLKFEARRHYVFDTNHRACDQSIADIVPSLQTLVQRRFNIDLLIQKLKDSGDISVEEKVQIWEKIKVLSVARIIGIAYSYSLLTLALKAQISILAVDVCCQFEKAVTSTPSWLTTVKVQVENYLGFEQEPISDPMIETKSKEVAANRQIFIQCIEYLTCTESCSSISLTDRVNQEQMRELLDSIDARLSKLEMSFFSKLVAPLSEEERFSKDGVMQLLARLVKALESSNARQTLVSLIDFYLTAAVHRVPKEPVVLAKLLTSMPDVFHFISTDAYDSPLRNSAMPNERRILKFASTFAACAPQAALLPNVVVSVLQAAAYGTCVSRQAEGISKNACADEFSKLLDCVKKQRLKRANRILTFFKYNYKISAPFRVLVDGTFCNAALANKINLREQLPKYLGGDVEIATTKCVLAELESLGSPVYGALVIARQFEVDVCPHTPTRPAAECLAHLARRATKGKTKYIIATNDDSLSEKLRTIAGTPILYIKYNAILLDRVSEVSKTAVDDIHKNELENLKAIKAVVLGEQNVKKKKKKIKMNTVSICPRSTLVGTLSAPSSSLLVLPATEHYPTQIVAGGTNGEVYFMKYDGSTDVVKMPAKSNSPVTALACGNLRGRVRMRPELIAISADGFLQCVHPPYSHASSVYSQIVQSNIAAAYVTDVDGDGQEELVVFMTDRVVRTFRWSFEDCRLHPINKWEVPNQISALAVGEASLRGAEAWLSQMGARFYVCVPFSGHQPNVIYPQSKEKPEIAPLLSFKTFSYATYLAVTLCGEILLIVVKGVVGSVVVYEIPVKNIVNELNV